MAEANPLIENIVKITLNVNFQLTRSVPIGEAFAEASQRWTKPHTSNVGSDVGYSRALIKNSFGCILYTSYICFVRVSIFGSSWLGFIPLNSATAVAPLMIITLAVASTVHILSSVRQTTVETTDRRYGLKRHSDHGLAISVAVFITAIGFLSLNFSISPPF